MVSIVETKPVSKNKHFALVTETKEKKTSAKAAVKGEEK
jgi:ribosomal protein S17